MTAPLLAQYDGLSGKPNCPPILEKFIIEEPFINNGCNLFIICPHICIESFIKSISHSQFQIWIYLFLQHLKDS